MLKIHTQNCQHSSPIFTFSNPNICSRRFTQKMLRHSLTNGTEICDALLVHHLTTFCASFFLLSSPPHRSLPETSPSRDLNTPLIPRRNATFRGWGAARGLEGRHTGKNKKERAKIGQSYMKRQNRSRTSQHVMVTAVLGAHAAILLLRLAPSCAIASRGRLELRYSPSTPYGSLFPVGFASNEGCIAPCPATPGEHKAIDYSFFLCRDWMPSMGAPLIEGA